MKMSAVSLKSKSSVKAETWSNIFCNLSTEAKSCLFMKQLTTTCISTILYLRKIFPDNYFESKTFEGMTLKLLKPGKKNQFVDKIEKWLEGAFEAINKKYLKHLMLDIKDANSKLTLEIYTMTFNYQKGKEELNIKLSNIDYKNDLRDLTVANTRMNTIRLLQMCHAVTQSYSDLPSQITLDIRLSYHKETPSDYQPIGYEACPTTKSPIFPEIARSIEIGVTGTHHHFFRLVNKSCLNQNFFEGMRNKQDENCDLGNLNKENYELNQQKKQPKAKRELFFESSNANSGINSSAYPKSFASPKTQQRNSTVFQSSDYKISTPLSESTKSQENSNDGKEKDENLALVRCPCLSKEKCEQMFFCRGCSFSAHAECFGILGQDSIKKIRFYCPFCHLPESNHKCHDKVMISLKNSSDQQKLALLRKILKFCCQPHIRKITLIKINKIAGMSCSKKIAEIILSKMVEIGVAVPQGKKKNFLIDKNQLTKELPHYFYQLNCINTPNF